MPACEHSRFMHNDRRPMKLQRLWQPRNPIFWLMVVFNLLSSVCAWVLRSIVLPYPVMLLVTLLALGNVVFGLWCAWRLVSTPPAP
jgi:hypothetical protein